MKQNELAELSNGELLQKWKNIKRSNVIISASLMILIVVTIIRMIIYGFGFFILLPLFVAAIAIFTWNNNKMLANEIKSRNLSGNDGNYLG